MLARRTTPKRAAIQLIHRDRCNQCKRARMTVRDGEVAETARAGRRTAREAAARGKSRRAGNRAAHPRQAAWRAPTLMFQPPVCAHVPVTRMELSGIDAKRYARTNERHGNVRIDHNSTVTLVKEISEKEVHVEFRYTATYGPIGVIRIDGAMTYACDAKEFEQKWRTTNQMEPAQASEIHSAVMRVCVPQAVGIAKDLQLPPPIPLPQVQFQTPQQAQKGAVHHGPEVM
jgi:hypothetical protein